MMTHPAFELMRQATETHAWPKHYLTDFTFHDRNAVEALPHSTPFAWSLREHGTHLIGCVDDDAADYATAIGETWERRCEWYFWNGKTLTHCKDFDEVKNRIKTAVKRLPEWRITWRGGESSCHAVDQETAASILKRRAPWQLAGTCSGIHSV
jgi:hypothetical protein